MKWSGGGKIHPQNNLPSSWMGLSLRIDTGGDHRALTPQVASLRASVLSERIQHGIILYCSLPFSISHLSQNALRKRKD